MLGDLDPFEFILAESLSMTVSQLRKTMSNQEYLMWRAFYKYRSEMQQLEMS